MTQPVAPPKTSTVPNFSADLDPAMPLEERIQIVLDAYRPTLYMDGGDVQILEVDDNGIAHVKMLGACIDCPISLLTMKLGIQRLLKENFSEITGINAITDIDISALYNRPAPTVHSSTTHSSKPHTSTSQTSE